MIFSASCSGSNGDSSGETIDDVAADDTQAEDDDLTDDANNDDSADDDTSDDTSSDDDTGDDDLGPTEGFVTVTHGTFTMGSAEDEPGRDPDETQHEVTLTHDFEIDSTETTHADVETVLGWNPSYYPICGDLCPVEWMNWFEAAAYAIEFSKARGVEPCYELSNVVCRTNYSNVGTDYMACLNEEKDGIWSADLAVTAASVYECEGFRLPTEAEWEYAARAGTTAAYYDGLDSDDAFLGCETPFHTEDIAWYCGEGLVQPQFAGLKEPNAWGLFDMSGNVWEWTWDVYGAYSSESDTDPLGAISGDLRTVRGGAWPNGAKFLRSANRGNDSNQSSRSSDIGFRLVRTMPEKEG